MPMLTDAFRPQKGATVRDLTVLLEVYDLGRGARNRSWTETVALDAGQSAEG